MRRAFVFGVLIAAISAFMVGPAAAAKGADFSAHAGDGGATITVTSGVFFTLSGGGGGNRDFVEVAVECRDGSDTVVYSTVLTVTFDASGNATSRTVFPPASHCTATKQKPMQIGRPHILATIAFDVAA